MLIFNPIKFADPTGMEGEGASSDSGAGGETGGGGVPGSTGMDVYGSQTINIGYGVYVAAGTAAISVSISGDSYETNDKKRNENASNNKDSTADPKSSDKNDKTNEEPDQKDQLKPPGRIELKGIPKEMLKEISLITEDDGATMVKSNGEYEGDGLYFKGEINNPDKSWFKVSSGWKATVTYNEKTHKFDVSTKQVSWHGSLPFSYHRFMRADETQHWSPNPFKK